MTADFGALDELFDPGLTFTLRGMQYRIDPPTAEVGLWCERIAQIAGGVKGAKTDAEMQAAVARIEKLPQLDDDDLSLPQRVLGRAYDELVANEVDHAWVKLISMAAFIWIVGDEDAARRYLQSGGRPESEAPNRQARRASRSTGGATKTRKPASTSGTRSRKTTTSPTPARASRGKTS